MMKHDNIYEASHVPCMDYKIWEEKPKNKDFDK